ncbi:MAG: hypothetical protein ACREAM_19335 [Blastocatellia bacterium]
MKIRKPFLHLVICLAVVSLVSAAAFADTIRLRDGSVLKGKVVSYSQRKFTIVVYIGGSSSQHVIPIEEIDSVEFDSSDVGAVSRAEPVRANPPSVSAPSRAETPRDTAPAPLPGETTTPRDESRTAPESEPPPNEANTGAVAAIAEKTVSVAGAADWTSTEIRVQRGQRIVISASGEVDLGDSQRTGPDGLSTSDNRKLIAARPTGALIAVVGDDNDDFVFVGKATEFVSPHNGILFLSVNEGNLKDNAGAFVARVRVLSGR